MSLFGAAWTVGSLKYLAEQGVWSITYYETTGWRGVMERSTGSPLPEKFHSPPGAVFPLYHVLADIGEVAGGEVIRCISSDTLRVDGLAIAKDGRLRIVLANLGVEPQTVTLHGIPGTPTVRYLDETNVYEAMTMPEAFRATPGEMLTGPDGIVALQLRPYAVARINTEDYR